MGLDNSGVKFIENIFALSYMTIKISRAISKSTNFLILLKGSIRLGLGDSTKFSLTASC